MTVDEFLIRARAYAESLAPDDRAAFANSSFKVAAAPTPSPPPPPSRQDAPRGRADTYLARTMERARQPVGPPPDPEVNARRESRP